jgi:hypothetical protein
MLPKEHGAYGQLACPLITALAVADWNWPVGLTTLAAVGGFLAHEPLLVLGGRRGPRARRETGARAQRWLIATGALAASAGTTALWLAPAAIRWSFLMPLVPATLLLAASWSGREKTAFGEVAAALAFSFVALPVCLAGGTPMPVGLSIALAFAALFATSTLGVRVVILRVRGGGDPARTRVTRAAVLALSAATAAGLAAAALRDILPWAGILASAPGLVLSVALVLRPPAPTQLRTIGWLLVSASSAAVIILIALLERAP